MTDKFYITTPIYYVNDVPHIGHAYTTIAADVIARFKRLCGEEVMFLTGTDEHGQKIEKSAFAKNKSPKEFVDELSISFKHMMKYLNISNDDFIRTTEERHKKAVIHVWNKLVENGDIYLDKYAGWYSVSDEAFYSESDITADGLAPTGAKVEWIEEESYFFKLSKWQDKLIEFYSANKQMIKPASRYNEVISFLKSGLNDLSISRISFEWGVKVPDNPKHVIYVWLDALTNYLSATGYPINESGFQKFWPADLHIVGKDILRFHAIYWPAFLMSLELEIPKNIFAHGWWTNNGVKISKSVGNVINPLKLVNEFGVDQVRYFLMREVILGNDGNYEYNALVSRINSELSNKIGNLLQRTISLIHQNNEGKVPEVQESFVEEAYSMSLLKLVQEKHLENLQLINNYNINGILDNIIMLSEQGNLFINNEAPWSLKNTNPTKMLEILYILLEALRYIGVMLLPFIPASATKILDSLSIDINQRDFIHLTKEFCITPGIFLPSPIAIFPRVG